jgi:hypothetical protein
MKPHAASLKATAFRLIRRMGGVRFGRPNHPVLKEYARFAILLVILLLVMPAAAVLSEPSMPLIDRNRIPATLTVRTPTGTRSLITYSRTVIDALDEAGIAVGEKDILSLPDTMILEPGSHQELTLLKRHTVTLSYAGFAVDASAEQMTLSELMSRSGFASLDTSDGSRIIPLNADHMAGDGTIIA